jgi:hypothetical protein
LWGKATGFSTDIGDDAKRAAGVAAVLDLQGGARVIPFPTENGSDENVREFEDVTSEDRGGMKGERLLCGSSGRSPSVVGPSKLRPCQLISENGEDGVK